MRAAVVSMIVLTTSAGFISTVAAQPAAPAASPTISAFLVKPLQQAQAAARAGDVSLEIATLLQAQAIRGRKSDYDSYLIDSWLAVAYVHEREFAKAEPLLVAAAQSPYASAAQRKGFTEAAVSILTTPPPK
jgi:hypothetical protein